jgi:hypothetical protein
VYTISKSEAGGCDEIISNDELHHFFRAHKDCSYKDSYASEEEKIADSMFHNEEEK